jgi:hypothetical protein
VNAPARQCATPVPIQCCAFYGVRDAGCSLLPCAKGCSLQACCCAKCANYFNCETELLLLRGRSSVGMFMATEVIVTVNTRMSVKWGLHMSGRDTLAQVNEGKRGVLPCTVVRGANDKGLDCLSYEAPWLLERLCGHGVAANEAEANSLFTELKRYLLLTQHECGRVSPMFSSRIDEVWHQFILFTAEYAAFCERYFGRFLDHVPEQSRRIPHTPNRDAHSSAALSFEHFRAVYEAAFGKISLLWNDEQAVGSGSRVTHGVVGLYCREQSDVAELVRAGDEQVVCRTSRRACEALHFIARTSLFIVRELPQLRGDIERVRLARVLVQYGALRLKY